MSPQNMLWTEMAPETQRPRDHVDMLMSLATVTNVVIVDMANMIVAHARNRGYSIFEPFDGRVASCTPKNVEKASNSNLEVDWS